jgi:hypothetical protein
MRGPNNGFNGQLIANDTKVWPNTFVQLFRLFSSGFNCGWVIDTDEPELAGEHGLSELESPIGSVPIEQKSCEMPPAGRFHVTHWLMFGFPGA